MSYLMQDRFSWGPRDLGMMFAYFGLILIFVQGGLVGRLGAHFGEKTLMRTGIASMATGLACIAFSSVVATVYIGLTFISVGTAIFNTSTLAFASMKIGPDERGLVMGVFQSMQSLGRSVGPIAAGLLYLVIRELPFFLGIAIMITLFFWLTVLLRRSENSAVGQGEEGVN